MISTDRLSNVVKYTRKVKVKRIKVKRSNACINVYSSSTIHYSPAAKCWKMKFNAPVDYKDIWYNNGKKNAWFFYKSAVVKVGGRHDFRTKLGQRSCLMFFQNVCVRYVTERVSSRAANYGEVV